MLCALACAREREINSPWYSRRTVFVAFPALVEASEAMAIVEEIPEGQLNGYAVLTPSTSPLVGIGGLSGNLWEEYDPEAFQYARGGFTVHDDLIPDEYLYELSKLSLEINGISYPCTGLASKTINWEAKREASALSADLLPVVTLADSPFYGSSSAQKSYQQLVDAGFDVSNISLRRYLIFPMEDYLATGLPVLGLTLCFRDIADAEAFYLNRQQYSPYTTAIQHRDMSLFQLNPNEWIVMLPMIVSLFNIIVIMRSVLWIFEPQMLILRQLGASRRSRFGALMLIVTGLLLISAIVGLAVYGLLLLWGAATGWMAVLPTATVTALLTMILIFFEAISILYVLSLLRQTSGGK